jgi:hypothetical protein
MTVEKFKSGTVFGDTKRPHEQIKELYPNAKFVPVCACGYYIQAYEDDSLMKLVADYMYLKNRDTIPLIARREAKPFGQFFKLVWRD